jgi:hypothetical protein
MGPAMFWEEWPEEYGPRRAFFHFRKKQLVESHAVLYFPTNGREEPVAVDL